LIELARTQRKASKTHTGSIDILPSGRDGFVKIVAQSDCDYGGANGLVTAIDASGSGLAGSRGFHFLGSLLDLICGESATIRYDIGSAPFTDKCTMQLPESHATLCLRFGADLNEELAKEDMKSSKRAFPSLTVIDGVSTSGTA